MFDELLHAPADKGARYVVQSNEDQVFEVDVPEPSILARIDTPEDYLSHFGMAPQIIAIMIELKEALQIVRDSARLLGTERVELSDALGRILAEDVASDIDMPPFDKATVDGYACRRADLGNISLWSRRSRPVPCLSRRSGRISVPRS